MKTLRPLQRSTNMMSFAKVQEQRSEEALETRAYTHSKEVCFKVKCCPQVGTILSIHFSTRSRFLLNHFPICTLVIRCRVPPRPLGMAHRLHVSNTHELYCLQQKPKSFKTTIQGKVPFLFACVNAHPLYFENRYVSTIQSTLALIKSTCYTLKSLLDSVQLLDPCKQM